jgi:hypothetical protein
MPNEIQIRDLDLPVDGKSLHGYGGRSAGPIANALIASC